MKNKINKFYKSSVIKTVTVFGLVFLFSAAASAQTAEKSGMSTETYAYLFLAALLWTLAVMFASFMIFESRDGKAKKKDKAVLQAEEDALLIQGHDYDGIRELDNKAPAWFQFIFYVTIVFAVVYMINFHLLGKNNLMLDEYVQEITVAQQEKEALMRTGGNINETNVAVLTAPEDIAAGKDIYMKNCFNCHGNNGEGTVGPNLTDDYWIHGGGIKNVFATISNGVPAKGMITWKAQLNPKQIQQAASYVLTLKGTNPPNGKAPEGNIWKEEPVKTDSTKVTKPDSTKAK